MCGELVQIILFVFCPIPVDQTKVTVEPSFRSTSFLSQATINIVSYDVVSIIRVDAHWKSDG